MEHFHLCINLSAKKNSDDEKQIKDTGVFLKISKVSNLFNFFLLLIKLDSVDIYQSIIEIYELFIAKKI